MATEQTNVLIDEEEEESEDSLPVAHDNSPCILWDYKYRQLREYQQTIYERAVKENLLVVIPTGLGKTLIAARLAAHFLVLSEYLKVIFLAPTRPLINQHFETLQKAVKLPSNAVVELNGNTPAPKRQAVFDVPESRIFVMTPQCLKNDLDHNLYSLKFVALIVFDEAHRATGQYDYVAIADAFQTQNANGRVLALTASPGSTKEKIETLLSNLHIPAGNIEYRDKRHKEVKAHSFQTDEFRIGVEMTPLMAQIQKALMAVKEETISYYIQTYAMVDPNAPTDPKAYRQGFCAEQIKTLKSQMDANPQNRGYAGLMSINARLMKLFHFIHDLEAEGLSVVYKSLKKVFDNIGNGKASKADEHLAGNGNIALIFQTLTKKSQEKSDELLHPKMIELRQILIRQFHEEPESRVLIFTKLRSTVDLLLQYFKPVPVLKAHRFVGQASKTGDKGMSQKEQISMLEEFKAGTYNVLIATNVAEEGLDIAECNLVVFYDNSASERQYIQRAGRTGRAMAGRVVILYTKGTADEVYVHLSHRKKKAMINTIAPGCPDTKKREKPIKNPYESKSKYRESELGGGVNQSTLKMPLMGDLNEPLNALPNERVKGSLSKVSKRDECETDAFRLLIAKSVNDEYQLDLGLNYDIIGEAIEYDLSYPQNRPYLGADVVKAKTLLESELFMQRLFGKAKNIAHYLVFVDSGNISPDELKQIVDLIAAYNRTKVIFSIFTKPETLNAKMRNFLTHHIK